MSLLVFPEPPTKEALASARRSLDATRASVEQVSAKILAAEAALAQIIHDSRRAIRDMEAQRNDLDAKMTRTLAYLSPIRRMPMELLRMVFMQCFEENPCSPWRLAAVCSSWRRLALRIPVIWSKVSAVSSQPCLLHFPPYPRPFGMIFDLPFAASGDRVFRRVFLLQLIPAASNISLALRGKLSTWLYLGL